MRKAEEVGALINVDVMKRVKIFEAMEVAFEVAERIFALFQSVTFAASLHIDHAGNEYQQAHKEKRKEFIFHRPEDNQICMFSARSIPNLSSDATKRLMPTNT